MDKDAVQQLKEMVPRLTTITLSGHSYGLGACQYIGDIIKDATKLRVNLNVLNYYRN